MFTKNVRIYALATMNLIFTRNSVNMIRHLGQGANKSTSISSIKRLFSTTNITLITTQQSCFLIYENHVCLLVWSGRVHLPLAVMLFFWGIHSHGRCKNQLWPNTISNSLRIIGHTMDESYSKELRRPEKHSNSRKCCHDITLALINGVSLCLYLNNLCEQRRAPQLGLFPW